ncbi:MAG: hypothetical protein ACT4P3_18730 [Betaproteobacteria bacterium]
MRISVLCHHGPKGEEVPCAFHLGGRRLPIVAVLSRWSDTPHRYFEVNVDDGRRFVLRHDGSLRCWELAGVFAAPRPKPRPKPLVPPQARPAAARWWRFGR